MEGIKVTLETLYDILRNEKKREDLQKLDDTFFMDVLTYFREKKALLELKSESENIFAAGEKEKLEYELRSIRRILKEIYEKREKKIIDIAMNKSRTGSDIIDTGAMLAEEKEFYEEILRSLNYYRAGVLYHLFKGEPPNVSFRRGLMPEVGGMLEVRSSKSKDEDHLDDEEGEESFEDSKSSEPAGDTLEKVKVRLIHPVPSFVWKDMKVYGPYDKGEEIEIFPEVAELLIRKGRAAKN
jgi:DNA replication initiation complex subunit (GINS family)